MFRLKNPNKIELQEDFKVIANQLFNSYVLKVDDELFRLTEIEFYYRSDTHRDEFTHKSDAQLTNGFWYFHNRGAISFRRKGLDITFGNENEKIYGGILLRGMIHLKDGTYFNGPSLLVSEIYRILEVNRYVDKIDIFNNSVNDINQRLALLKHNLTGENIYNCNRVGLTLKGNSEKNRKDLFIDKPYRFYIYPDKKHKNISL